MIHIIHIHIEDMETAEKSADPMSSAALVGSSSSSAAASQLVKSQRDFAKLDKQADNLDLYYKKSLQRLRSCFLCLGELLEPLDEPVAFKVRSAEIVQLLKRVFTFDLKKLVSFLFS